jgi:hypothetical protein
LHFRSQKGSVRLLLRRRSTKRNESQPGPLAGSESSAAWRRLSSLGAQWLANLEHGLDRFGAQH